MSCLVGKNSLKEIYLDYNKVSDLTPLYSINNLKYVSISNNYVGNDECEKLANTRKITVDT